MSRTSRSQAWNVGAAVLALTFLVFASACKKKPPAPPPAPVVSAPPPSAPAPDKPSISFTAEPSSIQKGQSAVLHWSVSDATDMTIDQGVGPIQSSGQRQVYPTDTATYTLMAKGPGGSDSKSVTVEVGAPPPPPPPPTNPTVSFNEAVERDVKDVYFDYDKSDIRSDAQQTLTGDADALKRIFSANSSGSVAVQGNCDERGSAEYNLGLGDRRARAAKDYLVQLGVSGERLTTVSFGKEKPVCTDTTEDCYQRNRHDHFAVQ